MKKGKTLKSHSKLNPTHEKGEGNSRTEEAEGLHMAMEGLQASIGANHKEILVIRTDMKEEWVYRKLNEMVADMKESRAEESLQRVAEIEEWTAAAKEKLAKTVSNQDKTQAKLTKIEARSCRNNVRVYGIAEDIEGYNLLEFIERFIKAELSLPN